MRGRQSLDKQENELWWLCKRAAHEAVDIKQIEKLLRGGADVNSVSNGWTLLLWVCWKNRNDSLPEIIRILIKYGADVRAKNVNGNGVLHILTRFNQTTTLVRSMKALIDGGVDVNQKDERGWTVLHYLARFNQTNTLLPAVKLLLNRRSEVLTKDAGGWNVLHYLARFYQGSDLFSLFQMIIKDGIDLTARDTEGWNVLHLLCRYYSLSGKLQPIIELLVDNGVELGCRIGSNLQALELLLFNSGGEFHSICDWVMEHHRSAWDRLPWNMESVLNMAKLGCHKWMRYFMDIKKAVHCEDARHKSALDYLTEVYTNSNSLCSQCKSTWSRDMLTELFHKSTDNRMSVQRIRFRNFVPSQEEQSVCLRSCSILSTVHDIKPVPEPKFWRKMESAWRKDKLSLDDVEYYLVENSHCYCQFNCRFCLVSMHVVDFLNSLTDKIGELDERFASGPLIAYGSWAERTDILAANEFDYGIPLKHFSALTLESVGIADAIVFTMEDAEADTFYTDYGVSSGRLLYYYRVLIEEASSRVWNVRFFHPIVTISETCVTLTFVYRGQNVTPAKISVDLSLVVNVSGRASAQFYENNGMPHLPSVLCQLRAREDEMKAIHLVPHRRSGRGRWKASFFVLERDVFLHSSCFPDVSHVLRLLKFFVLMANTGRNPRRDESDNTIQRKTTPSSYALKTCLFHYMNNCSRPPWNPSDRLDHCIGVLNIYLSLGSHVESFFGKNILACEISYVSKMIVKDVLAKIEKMKDLKGYNFMLDKNKSASL